MPTENAFETSDKILLKGDVTGVTRISKRVKLLLGGGGLALLGFICFAIFTIDGAGDSTPKPGAVADTDPAQKKNGHEPAQADSLFKGIGDGNAIAGTMAPSFDVGPIDSGVTMPGKASAVMPSSSTASPVGLTARKVTEPSVLPVVPAVPTLPAAATAAELAAKRVIEQRDQQRNRALQGEIEVNTGWGTGTANAPGPGISNAFLAGVPGASAGASVAGGTGAGLLPPQPQQDDQNKQLRKETFLREGEARQADYYLKELRRPPISAYELKMGWKIPAFLEDGVNSDLPGTVCARVRENVYDSATGKYLLIPQGTKACGTYDSQVSIGQNRVLIAWNRLIFPDGSTMNLQGMPGVNQAGYAGFDAEVDNHYIRVFTGALLMSVVSAAVQLSQPQQSGTGNAAPSTAQTASASLGQQLGQVGIALAQRDLKIQPTLTQKPGYRMNIQVARDMVFSAPYSFK